MTEWLICDFVDKTTVTCLDLVLCLCLVILNFLLHGFWCWDSDWFVNQAVGKQIQSRRELEQTRKMFFPHWRSLLTSRYTVKVFPFYAHMMERDHVSNLHMAGGTENGLKDKWCSPVGVSLLGKPPQLTSTSYQSRTRRLFGTAALTLLKTLKRAWVGRQVGYMVFGSSSLSSKVDRLYGRNQTSSLPLYFFSLSCAGAQFVVEHDHFPCDETRTSFARNGC